MKKLLLAATAAATILILAGCPSGTFTVGDFLEVTIDSEAAELNADGVLDFGLVQAESESETVSITITNIGDEDISVTSITISSTNHYSLGLPELPGVLAPGDTTQYSLTFEPMTSGSISATISIIAQDFTDPAELDVTGEGNYAPVPGFGVTVSGAGTSEANGFYERDGFKDVSSQQRPLYSKEGNPSHHIYIFDTGDPVYWGLDDSLNAGPGNYPLYQSNDTALVPSTSGWEISDDGVDPPPDLTMHDIVYSDTWTGEILTAFYTYFDEEDDPEVPGSAAYQWYRGDSESGPFSVITGETSMTYLTDGDDDGKYIAVGVTLTAASGVTAGEEVLSDTTLQFFTD